MNKLWVALFLYASGVNLSAAKQADLQLKWREEPTNERADFTLKWREEQTKETVQKKKPDQPDPLHENRARQPNPLGRIHRSDRQRFIDPNFSEFNSDGGYRSGFGPRSDNH